MGRKGRRKQGAKSPNGEKKWAVSGMIPAEDNIKLPNSQKLDDEEVPIESSLKYEETPKSTKIELKTQNKSDAVDVENTQKTETTSTNVTVEEPKVEEKKVTDYSDEKSLTDNEPYNEKDVIPVVAMNGEKETKESSYDKQKEIVLKNEKKEIKNLKLNEQNLALENVSKKKENGLQLKERKVIQKSPKKIVQKVPKQPKPTKSKFSTLGQPIPFKNPESKFHDLYTKWKSGIPLKRFMEGKSYYQKKRLLEEYFRSFFNFCFAIWVLVTVQYYKLLRIVFAFVGNLIFNIVCGADIYQKFSDEYQSNNSESFQFVRFQMGNFVHVCTNHILGLLSWMEEVSVEKIIIPLNKLALFINHFIYTSII